MIEAAVDRNITFRLKGPNSYLNVNNMNVLTALHSGTTNDENTSNSQLVARLQSLEDQIRAIPTSTGRRNRPLNQNVMQRILQLENRINNSGNNSFTNSSAITILDRRLRLLENRFNRLFQLLSADNCTSNPCRNGGFCSNTFGGYICSCTDAWTGNDCDEDVNECSIYAGTALGCQNAISCENTPGSYT